MTWDRNISVIKIFLAVIIATTSAFDTLAEKKIVDDLPNLSETITNFSIPTLKKQIKESNRHHIEGFWKFTSTGVEVAIFRRENDGTGHLQQAISYNLILLFSPNRALRAGTIMGILTPTPKQGEYDARIYTQSVGSTLTIPKQFTLTLSDDESALTFRQHRSAFSFKPWRLLPYFWRGAIQQNREAKSAEGCIRIYPEPTLPLEPIYL